MLEILSHLKKFGVTLILLIGDRLTPRHRLERVPEPQVSDETSQVEDYDRVMESSMSAIYVFCLGLIYRLVPEGEALRVADICCGPGQFTKLIKDHLNCQELYGVDLSAPMLEKLQKNVPEAKVLRDDMTELNHFAENGLDLTLAMNCLHHLPDQSALAQALAQLDRVTSPSGVVFAFDVARLKTAWQTHLFTETFGNKGREGFEFFHRDFELSMAAAWSLDELVSACPQSGKRSWYLLSPLGIPSLVGLIGLPADWRAQLGQKTKASSTSLAVEDLIPPEFHTELRLLRLLMPLSRLKEVSGSNS